MQHTTWPDPTRGALQRAHAGGDRARQWRGYLGRRARWQRELKEKFDETVLKGDNIREQFGMNQWLEQKRVLTSLDLAKRTTILPGLQQMHRDLVILDEAHRMSWSPPARKTARYTLGELRRDTTDHLLHRARRLAEQVKRARELARLTPPDLPDPEEMEEMEEHERQRLETILEAVTLASNEAQVREEIDSLQRLATQAQDVEAAGAEAKLARLQSLLRRCPCSTLPKTAEIATGSMS